MKTTMASTLFDTFIHSLRDAMRSNGLSQQELAKLSGVHFVTINRLLKGSMDNCTFELAEKLLDAAKADKTQIRQKVC